MRRTVSMPSALIKFPLRDLAICIRLSTPPKAGLQIPQDCGSGSNPRMASWLPRRLFAPSGDQPQRKSGQQPRVAGEAEVGIGKPDAKQPFVELRSPLQAEQIADIERIMERGGLIIQHDVVGS